MRICHQDLTVAMIKVFNVMKREKILQNQNLIFGNAYWSILLSGCVVAVDCFVVTKLVHPGNWPSESCMAGTWRVPCHIRCDVDISADSAGRG